MKQIVCLATSPWYPIPTRSSWMLIHAEGPLQELYDVLHGNGTAEEIREYAGKVTGQGETIIRLARKEMERTVWEE